MKRQVRRFKVFYQTETGELKEVVVRVKSKTEFERRLRQIKNRKTCDLLISFKEIR